MYRIFLSAFLLIFACKTSSRNVNVSSLSLRDNENMIYENYIFSNKYKAPEPVPQDTVPSKVYSPFVAQTNDATCVYGCTTPPLRIAVMPMSFKSKTALDEISNIVAFLNSNINQNKYHVSIINPEQDFINDFGIVPPDVIIGPFTDEDVQSLYSSLKQNNINVPIISLTTKSSITSDDVRYFGYSVDDTIGSVIDEMQKKDIKSYGILVPNTAIGSATYNLFKKRIDASGGKLARVEFYEEDAPGSMQKYVDKIKMAVNQVYYVAQNGTIIEDDHSFTKKIKEEDDKTVTLKDGSKYERKYKKMGALILDADPQYFEPLFDMVANDPEFEDILLLGTTRVADAVIKMTQAQKYESYKKPLLFPANFGLYRDFYLSYAQQFNIPPTKLGVTLYETAIYLITLHDKSDITKGLKLQNLPVFVGLNGTMVANREKNITRYTDTSEFKKGRVTETKNIHIAELTH